jgi:hypothetical protein
MRRSAFISLVAASVLFVAIGSTATLAGPPTKTHKHDSGSSWDFDFDFSDWFEGFGEAFSGPRRSAPDFKWSGKVAAGKTIEIRGVNGPIRAVPTSGSEVELVAKRTGRRSDPESVKIDVVPHANGVTICAVYPSRDESRPNRCEPGGGRMSVRNNDVNVEFEVRVPKAVNFEGRTVNGAIRAEVDAKAAVSTVNGSVEIEAGTLTEATTVNGSIRATVMDDASGDIKLTTVNGSVRLTLPEDVNAAVSARTVNGGIASDFAEIEIKRRWGPRSAQGTLGRGGAEMELSTVNGAIKIQRHGSER